MSWFKRNKQGITTTTTEKKETPEGLWYKCPECKKISSAEDHKQNKYVCIHCSHHQRIGSAAYYEVLFDNNEFTEINADIISADPLGFNDTKKYSDRIQESIKKTSLNDAIKTAYGKVGGHDILVACMDFSFIGGSMGAVMGEKISRAIDFCIDKLFTNSHVIETDSNFDKLINNHNQTDCLESKLMHIIEEITNEVNIEDMRILRDTDKKVESD